MVGCGIAALFEMLKKLLVHPTEEVVHGLEVLQLLLVRCSATGASWRLNVLDFHVFDIFALLLLHIKEIRFLLHAILEIILSVFRSLDKLGQLV